ncbi:Uncharacterised protein [Mannheimia haemolytica]|nr:Uncharacterised protein [Mannheimia haemolytica]
MRKAEGFIAKIPVRILGAENEPPPPYLIAEEMQLLIEKYQQKTDRTSSHRGNQLAAFSL